ncbi:DUF885 domain-containing protein [Murimonas intestini]|uniref:DUF885 domain-containing protein n=1 Tax=Murimonas intestini TaxID=1337051 RepID=UPI0011DCFF96|nr:DUF885 domain-containing protein [Murimonas intestini]
MKKVSLWRRAGCFLLTGGLVLSMSFAGVQPAAAASSAVTAAREPEEEQQAFDEYMDELFIDLLNGDYYSLHLMLENPSEYGIDLKRHAFDKTLFKEAGARDDEWQEEVTAVTDRLSEFDFDLLDEEQQRTYRVVWEYFKNEEAAADLGLYYEPLSYVQGVHSEMPVLLSVFTIMTREDARNYLELVADIDEYYRAVLEYEQKRSEAGLFMSDDALDMVLEDCRIFADREAENILVACFPDQLDGIECITEEEKQEYVECLQTVVDENFYPAYEGLIEGLEKLRGTGKNDEGICYFEKGKEYYEYLVNSKVATSYEMDEVSEIINESLQNITDELNTFDSDTAGKLLSEEFDSLDPDEILKLMQERSREDWPDIGELVYEFREVPEKLEDSMNLAFYMLPPLDIPMRNIIYVNNAYIQEDFWTTVAHEGVPGHMYQTNYNNLNNNGKGYGPIRRMLENNGYAEGWGTYAEIYSLSYAGLSGEAARLRKLISLQGLGIAAMLDVGINYEGWSREEVYNKLHELFDEENSAFLAEYYYDYVINNPAGMLPYYLGYLEITDMRDEAEETLGEKFSLRDFHTFMLDEGNAPFTVIREDFKKWISEQKACSDR